jgi:DNA polymerase III epsilon subunit-like protein
MGLCTKQRALWLFAEDKSLTPPADYKLGTLCQYFGVPLSADDAHDALADVRATVGLYKQMLQFHKQRAAQQVAA